MISWWEAHSAGVRTPKRPSSFRGHPAQGPLADAFLYPVGAFCLGGVPPLSGPARPLDTSVPALVDNDEYTETMRNLPRIIEEVFQYIAGYGAERWRVPGDPGSML